MLTIEQIKNAGRVVAGEFPIKKIMLFGSYADGTNTKASDVDLLIEFKEDAVSLFTLTAVKYRIEELLDTDVDIIHAPLDDEAMIKPEKVVEIYAA